jgi:AraC-like DNA-binding protein
MTATARDLVLTLLADQLGAPDEGVGAAQRTLTLRVKDYIHRHHRDTALGPTEIAAAANISTRYLHKLFTAESQTVSLYLRQIRLAGTRDDLQNPALADRSIAAIAHGRGFGDVSGFNRVFRTTYGATPRETRTAGFRVDGACPDRT